VEDPKVKKFISRQWRKFGGAAVKKTADEITFAEYMKVCVYNYKTKILPPPAY
jgi:hypothetical protein